MSAPSPHPDSTPFLPVVGASTSGATEFRCGLCGARFTHGTMACGSCPLHAGCDVVKCPKCGFQFPRSSRLVEWTRALVRRFRSPSR